MADVGPLHWHPPTQLAAALIATPASPAHRTLCSATRMAQLQTSETQTNTSAGAINKVGGDGEGEEEELRVYAGM
jgi:hypothetical protein